MLESNSYFYKSSDALTSTFPTPPKCTLFHFTRHSCPLLSRVQSSTAFHCYQACEATEPSVVTKNMLSLVELWTLTILYLWTLEKSRKHLARLGLKASNHTIVLGNIWLYLEAKIHQTKYLLWENLLSNNKRFLSLKKPFYQITKGFFHPNRPFIK